MPPSSASTTPSAVSLALSLAAAAWAVGLIAWFVLPATLELALPLPNDGAPVLVLIAGALAVTVIPWLIVTRAPSALLRIVGLVAANTVLVLLTGAATGLIGGLAAVVTVLCLALLHAGVVAANQLRWHVG
ncbi:MAG: hypothetical protein SF002_10150 [Alphaproteobacteria bacterium]|nr:hypothetical protein [Alphaproteobacteria bacterium]